MPKLVFFILILLLRQQFGYKKKVKKETPLLQETPLFQL